MSLGDTIKLGRIEFRVSEMQFISQETEELVQKKLTSAQKHEEVKQVPRVADPNGKECRICLMEDHSEEDFFITPCKCKGSSGTFHFLCFKKWFERKIPSKVSTNVASFSWKRLECEVCREPISKKIRIEDTEHEVIPIERPRVPYLILERLPKEKSEFSPASAIPLFNTGSFVSVLSFPFNEPINIGRGHQCNLRVSDISVSRHHATISYQNGKFLLLDNKSKFGTLVLMDKPYEITQEKIAVQVGRTVLSFSVKHPLPHGGRLLAENDPTLRKAVSISDNLSMTNPLRKSKFSERPEPFEVRESLGASFPFGREEGRSASLETRPAPSPFNHESEQMPGFPKVPGSLFLFFGQRTLPEQGHPTKSSVFSSQKPFHIFPGDFQTRNFGEFSDPTKKPNEPHSIERKIGSSSGLMSPDELNEILNSFKRRSHGTESKDQKEDLDLSFGNKPAETQPLFGLSSGVRGGFFNNELTQEALGFSQKRKARPLERPTTPPSALPGSMLLGSRRASSGLFSLEELMESQQGEENGHGREFQTRRLRIQSQLPDQE